MARAWGITGEAAHGFFIYNSVCYAPFVVRAPFTRDAGPGWVAHPVCSVDVMPTALDLLGVAPPAGISGVSAWRRCSPARSANWGLDAYSEALYPLHHYGWSDLRALRSGRYKVIDAPRPELDDLERDPARSQQPVRGAAPARRSADRASCDRSNQASPGRKPLCWPPTWDPEARSAPCRTRLRGIVRRDRVGLRARTAPIRRTRSPSSTNSGRATENYESSRTTRASLSFPQVVTILQDILAHGPRR